MAEQPVGTVTLVFTDIEGSTRLLHELGRERYRDVLAEHRRIVRASFARHAGYEVDYEGDSFFYAFQSAGEALAAVEEATRGLFEGPIRIRVGVHTGEPGLDGGKYVGLEVHVAARVMAAGHGGQVLVTQAAADIVDADLKPLGEHRFKDIPKPVVLFQLGDEAFPPLRSLGRSNLPVPPTRFIGRRRERKDLSALLARGDVRLVTVTGPGGTGKTRLVLEVGRELEDAREVLFVDLSTASDEGAPLELLAAALGVQEQASVDVLDAVATALSVRAPLLILDNCEQVARATGRLMGAVLAKAPAVVVLATSREPLHVQGEHRFALAPLPVPQAEDERPERAEAVRLFLDRLQMGARNVSADDTAVAAAAELVRRLDGLPLAIELAAARAALLGVTEVRDRLDARFQILTTERSDEDGRHRSLQAALDVSYQLLAPPAQKAFRTLGVFPTGFSLQAAEALLGPEAVEFVPALVDVSLLTIDDAGGGSYRYGLLDTLRAYAREQLPASEADEARHRLADWAVATAETTAATIDGPDEPRGLATLDLEGENCAGAQEWALAADPAAALRLALALAGWRWRRGRHHENIEALTRALESNSDTPPELRARALLALAPSLSRLGDRARAGELAAEAAAIFMDLGDSGDAVKALVRLTETQRNRGLLEDANESARRALELAREEDDASGIVDALGELGFCSIYSGRFRDAYRIAKEALRLGSIGVSGEARDRAAGAHAVAARVLGELDEAEKRCVDGMAGSTNLTMVNWYRGLLSDVRDELGRRLESLQLLQESFDYAVAVGEAVGIGTGFERSAIWALADGRFETAAVLWGAADAVLGRIATAIPMSAPMHARVHALAEHELGTEKLSESLERGRQLPIGEAAALVRDLHRSLRAAGEQGPRASQLFPDWRSWYGEAPAN